MPLHLRLVDVGFRSPEAAVGVLLDVAEHRPVTGVSGVMQGGDGLRQCEIAAPAQAMERVQMPVGVLDRRQRRRQLAKGGHRGVRHPNRSIVNAVEVGSAGRRGRPLR